MISAADIVAAFGIGLAGTGHCLGMCGGIAAALSLGGPKTPATTWAYHGGRVVSYTTLGAVLGLLAGSVAISEWTIGLRYVAGALMIAMGLAIAEWWRGVMVLERGGAMLWAPIQRLSSGLLPIRSPWQGFALGCCWGMMPCGLIYSALAWAATAQSASGSAILMAAFGVGTLPAMLATSLGASSVHAMLRHRGIKLFTGLFLILCGVWTITITTLHREHIVQPMHSGAHGSQHQHSHSQPSHSSGAPRTVDPTQHPHHQHH
ncbi:MAG: sulfite exporter TauE/SafE family protein [Pseudomonadota bacterium]